MADDISNVVMFEDETPNEGPKRAQVERKPSEEAAKKKNWITDMVGLYASGMDDSEVRKELGITKKQFDEYCQTPQFFDLVQRGREYAEAWWMSQGRKNLQNRDFITALWTFNVKNRYGWADKKEKDVPLENLNVDKLRAELAKKAPELLKMLGLPGEVIDLPTTRKMIANGSKD